jgi:hypothetical protein
MDSGPAFATGSDIFSITITEKPLNIFDFQISLWNDFAVDDTPAFITI